MSALPCAARMHDKPHGPRVMHLYFRRIRTSCLTIALKAFSALAHCMAEAVFWTRRSWRSRSGSLLGSEIDAMSVLVLAPNHAALLFRMLRARHRRLRLYLSTSGSI